MAVSIELKLDPLVKMEAKRHLNDTGRKKVASEVKRLCDPYVPFDTNAGSGRQGLTKQNAHNYKCLRGAYWDKRMMADKGDELNKSIASFCGGKAGK